MSQQIESALDQAREYALNGNTEIAEPWIRTHETTLKNVKAALAAMGEDISASEKIMIQPFADQKSLFRPKLDEEQ